MATIKSFTDIPQSKKLAEILPIESADMYYFSGDECDIRFGSGLYEEIADWLSDGTPRPADIPCWSLAVLYGILPNSKKETTTLSRGGWRIKPIEYLDNWWCEYEDDNHTKDFTVSADNPIDACVEMIIKLHEKNLL